MDLVTHGVDRSRLVPEVFVAAGGTLYCLRRTALKRRRKVLEQRLHGLVHCSADVVRVIDMAPDVAQGAYAIVQVMPQLARIVLNTGGSHTAKHLFITLRRE